MAYLKIFPIKVTDKKALDYITNLDKQMKTVSFQFWLFPETADLEFSMTREIFCFVCTYTSDRYHSR